MTAPAHAYHISPGAPLARPWSRLPPGGYASAAPTVSQAADWKSGTILNLIPLHGLAQTGLARR